MPSDDIQEQLTKYLVDAHSIESQALVQMRRAPEMAGDEEVARAFREHETETEQHEHAVREALERRGGSPSAVKEAVMRAGGFAFVLFAKANPDTPGKLATHAYSYEALELASYELLAGVAQRAGDEETVELARRIAEQERAMGQRLEGLFDRTAAASIGDSDPKEQLPSYLADAHAIEAQSIQLLERAPQITDDDQLSALFAEHLTESRAHQERIEQRLEALGSKPSVLKDAAMRLGALNWGEFFHAHPDTPGKLVAFAFAFEHLEIGGYEHLRRVAQAAGDESTVQAVQAILPQERAAADKLAAAFDHAVEVSLRAVGVHA
jgi:ferritin-like metal-binding protein YciE